jgi:hypothetical protein
MDDADGNEDQAAAALRRCREAWLSYSVVFVMLAQRATWTPEDMRAAVDRYRDLEPLIVGLNGDGGVREIRPTLLDAARVLAVEGDLNDAQILDAAARYFAGLREDLETTRLAGLSA